MIGRSKDLVAFRGQGGRLGTHLVSNTKEAHPKREIRSKCNHLSGGRKQKLKSRFLYWSIFGRFPAKLGPRTPPDGAGSKNGAVRT